MLDDTKCFIKDENGVFIQITYKKLKKLREESYEIRKKKFAKYKSMLFEIDSDIFNEYHSEVSRNKYWQKKEDSIKKISINGFIDSEDDDEYDVIPDLSVNIENETERKIELKELNKALMELNDEDYEIIKKIFFEGIGIREYARIVGIPFSTLKYKLHKIYEKIKKLIKN